MPPITWEVKTLSSQPARDVTTLAVHTAVFTLTCSEELVRSGRTDSAAVAVVGDDDDVGGGGGCGGGEWQSRRGATEPAYWSQLRS